VIKILQAAYLFKDELDKCRAKLGFDDRYKYYEYGYAEYTIKPEDNSWNAIELVSVDRDNNIVGYFKANICRTANFVSSLTIINFNETPNFTFGNDLKQFFLDLFYKFNFNKISFKVVVGNPAKNMYDRFIDKYGGRSLGIMREEVKLWDGQLYDVKIYEILKREFKYRE
jgi:hypothetical protein